jgi:hypothetical protein
MTDPMVQEWLKLLELTTEYMTAAEEVIDGLLGRYQTTDKKAAEAEVRRRVRRYGEAKRAMQAHARSREAMLS